MFSFCVHNNITYLHNTQDPAQLLVVENRLYDLLAYKKPGSFFSSAPEFLQWVRLYNRRFHYFPSGLLYKVKEFFDINHWPYEVKDERVFVPPKQIYYRKIKELFSLRKYQEEALASLDANPRGIIEVITGGGKSLIIQELIYQKGVKTLVITPSSNILNIFEEKLIDVYGKKHIGLITGGKKQFDKNITICTYQSLAKIDPKWFEGLGMVITDEAHHLGAKSLYDLNLIHFKNIYYRYGFSSTYYRNDETQMSLEAVMSNIIYKYGYEDGVRDGYICPVEFVMFENENGIAEGSWREEVRQCLTLNDAYNQKIATLAKGFDDRGTPTIIFVNEIEHGRQLKRFLPSAVFISGLEARSDNKKTLKDFTDRKFNILIGTSVIGEGVDTVPAQVGILASGFKAESEVVQKIGRLLRPCAGKEKAIFIDFENKGAKYLQRHARKRLQIYKTYNSTIKHLPL